MATAPLFRRLPPADAEPIVRALQQEIQKMTRRPVTVQYSANKTLSDSDMNELNATETLRCDARDHLYFNLSRGFRPALASVRASSVGGEVYDALFSTGEGADWRAVVRDAAAYPDGGTLALECARAYCGANATTVCFFAQVLTPPPPPPPPAIEPPTPPPPPPSVPSAPPSRLYLRIIAGVIVLVVFLFLIAMLWYHSDRGRPMVASSTTLANPNTQAAATYAAFRSDLSS